MHLAPAKKKHDLAATAGVVLAVIDEYFTRVCDYRIDVFVVCMICTYLDVAYTTRVGHTCYDDIGPVNNNIIVTHATSCRDLPPPPYL